MIKKHNWVPPGTQNSQRDNPPSYVSQPRNLGVIG